MKKYIVLFVFFIMLTACVGFRANKCPNALIGSWGSIPVTISIDPSFTSSEQTEIRYAAQTWNDAYGETLISVVPGSSNIIEIGTGRHFPNARIAETITNYVGMASVSTEIYFNPEYMNEGYDFRSVVIHEFGHFLGLDHNKHSNIMKPEIYSGEIERVIDKDSINALKCLYGSK